MTRIAVILGRYVPITPTHVNMIKNLCEEYNEVIIGLREDNPYHEKNFLTYEEKKRILQEILRQELPTKIKKKTRVKTFKIILDNAHAKT